jgi:uncharacterized protein YndB with AHSA1/START domain
MPDVEQSIVLATPPATAFALYERYDRHPEWQTEMLRAELTTPGPIRVGTRGYEVRRLMGRETKVPYEITEHVPPHRSAFRTLSGPIRFVGAAEFAPEGERTRMTFTLDLVAVGPLRLAALLLARQVRRQVPEHLARFKALAETTS